LGALTAAGWGWIACLAAVSTVAAISLFFAGLRRAGPTTASILSTVEPLTTVVLAFLVFGETLTALQWGGAALVLAAVVALAPSQEALSRFIARAQLRGRSWGTCRPPAPFPPSATSTSPTPAASSRPSATSASGGG
jgi:multidrug transporter EmrE-like cation transporter